MSVASCYANCCAISADNDGIELVDGFICFSDLDAGANLDGWSVILGTRVVLLLDAFHVVGPDRKAARSS